MSDPDKNSQEDDADSDKNISSHQISSSKSSISLSDIYKSPSLYGWGNELREYMEKPSMDYQVYPGAERNNYDFTAERTNMYNTNLIESTAHLVKGCLGAGILSIHVGYMYGGLWTSLVATFVIGPIVSYCMLMLAKSAQKMYVRLRIPKLTYPDLAEVAVATGPWKPFRRFSKTFRYIVDTTLFIEMCGTCCFYEIMIAKTVKQALEVASPTMKNMNLNERCYILIITAPLLVLCMIRNLKYLAPLSLAADIFIAICLISTMYFSISAAGNIQDRPTWKSFHGLVRFSGICLFSIDGVGVTLTVENTMRKPKYFSVVLQYGMTIVLICVTLIGFFGYWGWGETCKAPITLHMPPEIVVVILQFLIPIAISVTFAVQLWVPFNIAWHYIGRKHKRKRGIWERFYRTVHLLLITCLALAFPHMIELMIFRGIFFMALNAFIFPAFIESLVTWREHHNGIRWRLVKNCFLTLIGVILIGASFYSVLDL